MIPLLLSIVLVSPVRAPSQAERSPEAVEQLVSEMRLLDQAGLTDEILDRYAPVVAEPGPLAHHGEAVALVARAYFNAGEETTSWRMLLRAAASPKTYHYVELERVRLHMEFDELDVAIIKLTEPVKGKVTRDVRYPRVPESWLLLARIYARQEEYSKASPACVRFLAMAPRHREASTAWHILAQAALKQRDADHARECLDRAQELREWHDLMQARRVQIVRHPEDPLPRLGVALLWMEAEEYENAREILADLTRTFPDECRGWFQLGEAERLSGRPEPAMTAYDRALACDAEYHAARLNRGLLKHDAGRPEEAKLDLEEIVAGEAGADPLYVGAHLILARIYLGEGDQAKARARYARYVELGGAEALETDDD